ncbi:MAG: hypothetical protein KDA44_12990 [Planctomycetales bacterium]|nr:hypothetical protein [Planctomycetales bacterium]
MTAIVAGIDGGGTRTRAALATRDGELLAIGEAGSGNYHDVGVEGFAKNLDLAIERAWQASGATVQRIDSIFLGLGSVVTTDDRDAIRAIVQAAAWAPSMHIGVDHDLRIAHQGCLGGGAGVVLIAGTGSSAYARDDQGGSWKAGGWGPLLDDVGSGHWLGRQAMIAAIRASDGRGPATVLTAAVLVALGVESPLEILRRVELQGMTRSEIANLARLVLAAASQGDDVARSAIVQGVDALAELVATASSQLGLGQAGEEVRVAVTGGLGDAGDVFMKPLQAALHRRLPQAAVVANQATPVIGAAMLALGMLAGGAPDEAATRRLMESSRRCTEQAAASPA